MSEIQQQQLSNKPALVAIAFLLIAFLLAQSLAIAAILTYKIGINAVAIFHAPQASTAATYAPIFLASPFVAN